MKRFIWLLFLALLAILSYIREVLFLSINSVIAGNNSFYAKTIKIDFFLSKSSELLIQYKYAMTIGFTALFAILTLLGLKISFKNRLPFHLAIVIYGLCTTIAIIVIIYSTATNSFASIYSFLRLMIEYLHNPIIYLILSASFLGYNIHKNNL